MSKSTQQSFCARALVTALFSALVASSASAQSVWTTGSGNWSDPNKWTPVAAPVSGSSTVLEFGHTGTAYNATNDIAGDFQLNILRFTGGSAGNISLLRSGSQTLVFAANGGDLPKIEFNSTSSAAKTLSVPITLNADTTVTSSVASVGNLQLGTLGGTGALILDFTSGGGGVLIVNANGHSGGVQLKSGRLFVSNAGAFGTGALTLSGGLLRGASAATELVFTNTLNFAGNVAIFDGNNSRSFTFTNGGAVQGTDATHTITLGNATPVLTLGGAFTGAGNGLNFAGTGKVNLGSGVADSAANTYGVTTVSGSGVTLTLNKAAGTNAIAGGLAVSAGTVTWGGSNQIADAASVTQSGGTISLGAGLAETVASTAMTGGAFVVGQDAAYSTGALTVSTAGTRNVGGTLTVGSGGLVINHDGGGSTRNVFTLHEGAGVSPGVLLLNGDLTFNNATVATTKAQVTRGANTGYIDLGGSTRTFTINDGGAVDDLEITVRIANGGIVKEGAGVLAFLNTAADYSGDTVINAGTIRTNGSAQTLSSQSTYVLADTAGATLDLNGANQIVGGLSGGGASGGNVTLGVGTLTAGNNNANTTFSGDITGSGGLAKTGAGSLTLSGDKGFTGATLVSAGALVVNGQLASSGVTVNGATASLGGSGRVNSLDLIAGTFGPGNSPGAFTVDGNVGFGAASTFSVEIADGVTFDQLVVNGAGSTVTLADGATLDLSGFESLAVLAEGTTFTLIENNSDGSIVGAFSGYAEGHTFSVGANTFMTSYTLGGGFANDFGFVVTAVPEPSTVAALAGLAVLGVAALRRRRS